MGLSRVGPPLGIGPKLPLWVTRRGGWGNGGEDSLAGAGSSKILGGVSFNDFGDGGMPGLVRCVVCKVASKCCEPSGEDVGDGVYVLGLGVSVKSEACGSMVCAWAEGLGDGSSECGQGINRDGRSFASIEGFCEGAGPYGLGLDMGIEREPGDSAYEIDGSAEALGKSGTGGLASGVDVRPEIPGVEDHLNGLAYGRPPFLFEGAAISGSGGEGEGFGRGDQGS